MVDLQSWRVKSRDSRGLHARISLQMFMVNFWTYAALYIDSLWAHLYVDAISWELWSKLKKKDKKVVWAHHHAEERDRVKMTNDEAIEYLRKEISEEEMEQHLAIMDQDMANLNISDSGFTVVWAFRLKKYQVPVDAIDVDLRQ